MGLSTGFAATYRMEPVLGAAVGSEPTPSKPWSAADQHELDEQSSHLRAELERLQQREAQIMALVGCKNPDKLIHDLRNVLNELQLLRALASTENH